MIKDRIRKTLGIDNLSKLRRWADRTGAELQISSSANPERIGHEVIISARNVRYHHPMIGETFVCAQGADSDEAARKFMQKVIDNPSITIGSGNA